MSASLTVENRRLLKALLQVGRWANESEIMRYGLHLVAREVESERRQSLEPLAPGVLARAYRQMSRADRAADRAMSRASAYPTAKELDS